jgi:DNA primase
VPGVALLGNRVSPQSVDALSQFGRLYVALDPDDGGQVGTAALQAHFGERVIRVVLPDGHDIADLAPLPDGPEKFTAAVRAAVAA